MLRLLKDVKFFALVLVLLAGCASQYHALNQDSASFEDKANEAKKVLDNSRAYVVSDEIRPFLFADLTLTNPYANEPTPELKKTLTDANLAEQQYREELLAFSNRQSRGEEDAARIRQAAMRLLGRSPDYDTFYILANMIFDSDEKVQQEALSIIEKGTPITLSILVDIASDNDLPIDLREQVLKKIARMGQGGLDALIALLANYDDNIAKASATQLAVLFNNYPDQILGPLTESSLANDRFKAPFWLAFYENEAALYGLLALTEDDDNAISERSIAVFDELGRWTTPYILTYLEADTFPKSRELLIKKICAFGLTQGMLYLEELFASSSEEIQTEALAYASQYGILFLPIARKLFFSENTQVAVLALQTAKSYNDKETLEAALNLLNINSSTLVVQNAQELIKNSFPSNEDLLMAYFSASRNSSADLFILSFFIENGSFMFLQNRPTGYKEAELTMLLNAISNEQQWRNYLEKISNAQVLTDLNSFYRLYQQLHSFSRTIDNAKRQNALLSDALAINELALEVKILEKNEQQNMQTLLNTSTMDATTPNLEIRQKKIVLLRRLDQWHKDFMSSRLAQQAAFKELANEFQLLSREYWSISATNQAIADQILAGQQVDFATVRSFIELNFPH